jgi:2-succinyl-5-enolpyruvyl-6-hydroxy-3-cyclohexene-1-carboxylate synthase
MSNPSFTASQIFAANLLAEFVAAGVTDIYMAPGARSQALTIAAGQLAEAGAARLFVRLDERTLAFTALGTALADKTPKLIITTSGTSVANLHPAVLEAHHSGVPIILLTADRPHEARGVGVSQTTNQVGIFADAVRCCFDVEAPQANENPQDLVTLARNLVAQTLQYAYGEGEDLEGDERRPGPVQLNLAFTEPLSSTEPNAVDVLSQAAARVAVEKSLIQADEPEASSSFFDLDLSLPTVIIAGADSPINVQAIAPGVPLLAEPSSGVRFGEEAILGYRAIIDQKPELISQIKQVLIFGKPTLSRQALSLVRLPNVRVLVWPSQHGRFDIAHNAEPVKQVSRVEKPASEQWLLEWKNADAELRPSLDPVPEQKLDRANLVHCLWMAAEVVEGQTANWLVLGASRMIREAETWAPAI